MMRTNRKQVLKYLWMAIYLALWLVAFSLWNRLSNIQPMTIMQSIVSLIYVMVFIWIIRCPRTLWKILGAFYGIIVLRYLYSAWFYKKTVEGFETSIKENKENKKATDSAPAAPTAAATAAPTAAPASTPPSTTTAPAASSGIIPLTKESMEGATIVEVDEWSEADKRKIEGNPVRGLSEITSRGTEEDKEKQRTGITFTSAANAQQETYKLIDAVQQLQEVMTNLSPTLREGKKIIDMFDKFQIKK